MMTDPPKECLLRKGGLKIDEMRGSRVGGRELIEEGERMETRGGGGERR